jgi:hypothetical protein
MWVEVIWPAKTGLNQEKNASGSTWGIVRVLRSNCQVDGDGSMFLGSTEQNKRRKRTPAAVTSRWWLSTCIRGHRAEDIIRFLGKQASGRSTKAR